MAFAFLRNPTQRIHHYHHHRFTSFFHACTGWTVSTHETPGQDKSRGQLHHDFTTDITTYLMQTMNLIVATVSDLADVLPQRQFAIKKNTEVTNDSRRIDDSTSESDGQAAVDFG